MAEPIVVDLGGGVLVEKPEEMSIADFEIALNAYQDQLYAEEPATTMGGVTGAIARGAGPYGAGAVAGGAVLGPPGAIAGVGSVALGKLVGDPLIAGVNKKFGTSFATPTEAFNKFFDWLGVESPDTATEQFVELLSEGAASGPMSQGRGVGRQVGEGITAAATGETARMAAEQAGAGQVGQLVASMVGGVGGGLATAPRGPVRAKPADMDLDMGSALVRAAGQGDEAAKRTLASQAASGIDPGTMRAAEQLGIAEYMTPGQLTSNKVVRELEAALAEYPLSSVASKQKEGMKALVGSAENLMQSMVKGDAFDLSSITERTKSTMKKTIDDLEIAADDAYTSFNKTIDVRTRHNPKNVLTYLSQRIQDLGGGKEGFRKLDPLERRVWNDLMPERTFNPDAVRMENTYPTYASIDQLRKSVGKASAGKGAGHFKDADTGVAKKIYGLLTDDQNTAARSLGGDTQLLEYGKALVNQRKAVEDQFVMLFGKDLDKSMSQMLTTGTERLAKGDADSFKKIMQAVPTELRPQVAASAVSSMMLKRAKNGELNMEQFASWYGAVKRNKVAHQALLGSMTPEARIGLDNLHKIAKITTENIDPKHVAYAKGAIEGSSALIDKIYWGATKATGVSALQALQSRVSSARGGAFVLAHNLTNAAHATAKTKALKNANRLIGSPEFQDMVRAMADGRPIERYVNALSKSQMMMTFVRQANLSTKQEDIRQWIYDSVGPKPANKEAPAR